jgi:hypothetical protein
LPVGVGEGEGEGREEEGLWEQHFECMEVPDSQ